MAWTAISNVRGLYLLKPCFLVKRRGVVRPVVRTIVYKVVRTVVCMGIRTVVRADVQTGIAVVRMDIRRNAWGHTLAEAQEYSRRLRIQQELATAEAVHQPPIAPHIDMHIKVEARRRSKQPTKSCQNANRTYSKCCQISTGMQVKCKPAF